MDDPLDQAVRRVAVAFRAVGAGWMLVLAVVLGLVGDIARPGLAAGLTAVALAWAAVVVRAGGAGAAPGRSWWVLVVDLAVAVAIVVGPAVAGDPASYYGGYPFASLVVGLAVGGRRGAVAAAMVLALATLTRVAVLGQPTAADATGSVLLYVLGTVVLVWGLAAFRRAEERVRQAEAALARSEERARTAAHLHDSVLQTLALVQRRAEEPAAVRSLARRQERELRSWLFGTEQRGGQTLEAALRDVGEEAEAVHGVRVSVVCVGQVEADGPVAEVVAAAREAVVNAARHAGVEEVSVFGEVTDGHVAVFVRDRGAGFDPDAVPADRQGVRTSIVGRMARAGGTAEIRSTPGRGTEVRLTLPLRS